MRPAQRVSPVVVAVVLVAACDTLVEPVKTKPTPVVAAPIFDPSAGNVPFPNDVLYAGRYQCADGRELVDPASGTPNCDPLGDYLNANTKIRDLGRVALPVSGDCTAPASLADQITCGINTLDGFSTIMPTFTPVTGAVNTASLNARAAPDQAEPEAIKNNVLLFELDRDVFNSLVVAIASGRANLGSLTAEQQQKIGLGLGFATGSPARLPYRVTYTDESALARIQLESLRPLKERKLYMGLVLAGDRTPEEAAAGTGADYAPALDAQGNPLQRYFLFDLLVGPNPLCARNAEGKNRPTIGLLPITPLDEDGNSTSCALETLRTVYSGILPALEAASNISLLGLPFIRSRLVKMVWVFRTQTVSTPLIAVRNRLWKGDEAPAPVLSGAPENITDQPNLAEANVRISDIVKKAKVWRGRLASPDYLKITAAPATASSPSAKRFDIDPADGFTIKGPPAENRLETIIAVPDTVDATACAAGDAAKCLAGVVIAQHGYTGRKENFLNTVDTFADARLAVVGIDMVLHGSRTDAACPQCTSGAGFIALDLFATRDHMRQSVIDLIQLVRSIRTEGTAAQPGVGGVLKALNIVAGGDLAALKIGYIGQSMGGIIGGVLSGVEYQVAAYTLNVAGGRLPYILVDSNESINGALLAALKQVGYDRTGTPEQRRGFRQFLDLAGWILEPADPFSYVGFSTIGAARWLDPNTRQARPVRPVLVQKITGDNTVTNPHSDMLTAAACNGLDPARFRQVDEKGPFWTAIGCGGKAGDAQVILSTFEAVPGREADGHAFITRGGDPAFADRREAALRQSIRFLLTDGKEWTSAPLAN